LEWLAKVVQVDADRLREMLPPGGELTADTPKTAKEGIAA